MPRWCIPRYTVHACAAAKASRPETLLQTRNAPNLRGIRTSRPQKYQFIAVVWRGRRVLQTQSEKGPLHYTRKRVPSEVYFSTIQSSQSRGWHRNSDSIQFNANLTSMFIVYLTASHSRFLLQMLPLTGIDTCMVSTVLTTARMSSSNLPWKGLPSSNDASSFKTFSNISFYADN